jgi:hypothetical protein
MMLYCVSSFQLGCNINFTLRGWHGRANAHAMNEVFKLPEMTAYGAAYHQHVSHLGLPGLLDTGQCLPRSDAAPPTSPADDPLHPWQGLNLY